MSAGNENVREHIAKLLAWASRQTEKLGSSVRRTGNLDGLFWAEMPFWKNDPPPELHRGGKCTRP